MFNNLYPCMMNFIHGIRFSVKNRFHERRKTERSMKREKGNLRQVFKRLLKKVLEASVVSDENFESIRHFRRKFSKP